jgi:hypothetical protein
MSYKVAMVTPWLSRKWEILRYVPHLVTFIASYWPRPTTYCPFQYPPRFPLPLHRMVRSFFPPKMKYSPFSRPDLVSLEFSIYVYVHSIELVVNIYRDQGVII